MCVWRGDSDWLPRNRIHLSEADNRLSFIMPLENRRLESGRVGILALICSAFVSDPSPSQANKKGVEGVLPTHPAQQAQDKQGGLCPRAGLGQHTAYC